MKANGFTAKVLIVSSNSFVRVGLRQTFEAHAGITIAGEAANSTAVRHIVDEGRPDLIVLDVDSDMKLTDIIGRLQHSVPHARIILLVDSADMERGRQGLDLGADVIMMKSQPAYILVAIIQSMVRTTTSSHGSPAHSAPNKGVAGDVSIGRGISSSASATDSLTEREREVVALVSKGLSNRDIAAKLCITETTIRHHLTRIFDKLGVSNRQKLLLLALECGLNEISASA